jgi:hypothetical protein
MISNAFVVEKRQSSGGVVAVGRSFEHRQSSRKDSYTSGAKDTADAIPARLSDRISNVSLWPSFSRIMPAHWTGEDINENVRATVVWVNESIALREAEPFDSSRFHERSLVGDPMFSERIQPVGGRDRSTVERLDEGECARGRIEDLVCPDPE